MSNPTKKVCGLVDVRDDHLCVRCGASLYGVEGSRHHRKLRSQGGKNDTENLILLCGSGTTGCHGFVHANPAASRASGWIVRSGFDPATVPVLFPDGSWWRLLEDGTKELVRAADAFQYMGLIQVRGQK